MVFTLAALLSWAVLFTPSLLEAQPSGRPAEYEVSVSRDVMVQMRDGTLLAADVYLPTRNGEGVGPLPVLVTRTPYEKGRQESRARYIAERGYAVVTQDVRGRHASEGEFYLYMDEARDGYDTIEWAARQPWSNGDVGTFGGSYSAATQMAAAVERPPSLKSMFTRVGTSNYLEDGAGSGGAIYLLHNVGYVFHLARLGKEAQANPAVAAALEHGFLADQLSGWIDAYPYGPNASPFAIAPSYERWFRDWMAHPDQDEYWNQNGYNFELFYDRMPDIPMYFVGGWYDIFLRGTLRNFAELSKIQRAPKKLLIGPWVHGVGPQGSGDVDFGDAAAVDILAEKIRWFDQTLKRIDTGILEEPPARVFVMGGGKGNRAESGRMNQGGEWTTAAQWPTPEAVPTPFYLHADGRLAAQAPAAGAPSASYLFDPADPVPTIGGKIDSGGQLVPGGPYDQRCIAEKIFGCEDNLPLSARRDVLVFQTPPLPEDVVINGPVTVRLWASSSAPDTDFTAKLLDVHPPSADYPEGYDLLLADRIVRGRYRDSLETPELMEIGEVYELEIDLIAVANRFAAGHRIRVDISSSNYPFFDVNSNTGEPINAYVELATARNTVYMDADRPSHILLPLIPVGNR